MKFFPSKRGAILLFSSLFSIVNAGFAQAPVSQAANSMVDLNTGDFKYSLPVMTVPGPNGENVPVTFSYHGGIKMEEQASWIGLGWDYNPGEISRALQGQPDDWKNKAVVRITKRPSASDILIGTSYYGPLYYKDLNYADTTASMDVAVSSYKLSSGMFYAPGYDSYYVSGPGISGKMEPRLFDRVGVFHMKDVPGSYDYSDAATHFTKTPQFVFVDELNANIKLSGGSSFAGAYNSGANRAHTASYIEFFTNSQINAGVTGFMDYRIISGTKRPSADFDSTGIGAFRITNSNGMIYHYSLPVYTLANEESTTFRLNGSAIDQTKNTEKNQKWDSYVTSWKLTAVTGPDYVDANSNGIADIGDTGYWIAYNYGLWANSFSWRAPYYGYRTNEYNKRVKSQNPGAFIAYTTKYGDEGTVSTGANQVYYLNSIQTASHTAFFIKDIRSDAHSVDNSGKTPLLKLSKIVLVKNENIGLFSLTGSLSFGSFSSSGCSSSAVTPHIGNYTANDVLIKKNSLAIVDLISDYSLCKYLYNNINSSYTTTSATWNGTELYKSASSPSGSNTGKLTLNEVKIYEAGYKASAPSYLFDYDQSNSAKNPDFNIDKVDYWGYYKSDYSTTYRGHYTTTASAANVDAWSLKKITTPTGGEISVEYESDDYNYVCSNNRYYSNPQRYFVVKAATYQTTDSKWRVTVNAEVNDFLSASTNKGFSLPHSQCNGNVSYGSDPAAPGGLTIALTTTGSASATQDVLVGGYAISGSSCGSVPLYDINVYPGFIKLGFSILPGAGTRVKKITLKDTESNNSYINEYTYERGVAGTEPADILVRTDFGTVERNNNAGDPLAAAPGVTYTKVNIKSKSLNNTYNGRTQYEFYNAYEQYMVNKKADVNSYNPTTGVLTAVKSDYIVTQTRGIVNAPKAITVYDADENIVKLTKYDYYTSSDIMPVVTEQFNESVSINNSPNPYYTLYGTHNKCETVARLKSKTTVMDGVSKKEEYLNWDNITGEPTKVRITDGIEGVTEIITEPAFRIAAYTAMGPKSMDNTYKNLLDPLYKRTIYRDRLIRDVYNELVPSGNVSLTAGTKTTWQQSYPKRIYDNVNSRFITQSTSSTWKPYQSYIFNGNSDDTQWKYDGEITAINKWSNPLELKDGNSRFTSKKMGYDQKLMLCQASDCKYADFTFSGFEDQEVVASGVTCFGGEVTHGEMRYAGDVAVIPHSGNYVAKVAPGYGPGFYTKGFTTGRSYRASVWVNKNSPATASLNVTLDGTSAGVAFTVNKSIAKSDASNVTIGDWTLMTITIDVPADYTETGGSLNDLRAYCNNPGSTTAYFDDFSFRPVDATISGNVYDEKTDKPIAILDNNNFVTKYVYDDAWRIKEIWTETASYGWKLKQRYSYNFKRSY